MSESYADHVQRARDLLASSSPAAARAMRARSLEDARPRLRRQAGEWRWIDRQAQESVEAQARLVEASPLEVEPELVDADEERRRVALARARWRARAERAARQNDISESTS